jgi:hypothetical protein
VIRRETKYVALKPEIERVTSLLEFLHEKIERQIGDLKTV